MTTMAVATATGETTTGMVVRHRQRPKKPTARLVAQLERELATARESCEVLNASLTAMGNALVEKNDRLVLALSDLDAALDRRDDARRLTQADYEENQHREQILQGDLNLLREDYTKLKREHVQLMDVNRRNFDKAARSADVSAVLASRIVAETDEGPVETVEKFAETANQMDVSLEVTAEVRVALKRAYVAQVEQTLDEVENAVALQASSPGPGVVDVLEVDGGELLSLLRRSRGGADEIKTNLFEKFMDRHPPSELFR